jgi:hypothetical protein
MKVCRSVAKSPLVLAGFGGNVVREEVRAKAKWFVTDFQELIDAL